MSLYHEAAEVLTTAQKEKGGSIKSIVFGKKNWKSDAKTLFALTTEAAKWSEVLAEVVEGAGVLKIERQLTPTLALLLVHDLFLSKRGIALPESHGLRGAVGRHKVRLSAELTKARLRRGCASLEALRERVNEKGGGGEEGEVRHPRWIRVNTLKTTMEEEVEGTFREYGRVETLKEVMHAATGERVYHVDQHIPDLLAITPGPDDPTTFASYKSGKLILQEKASCFPAYLLSPSEGEKVIDACAAPGNKTTHLAALGASVIACEKDPTRSETLRKMVKLAGAEEVVKVKGKQDFLRLKPEEFKGVTGLLMDPSCSGSGIWGRDEARVTLRLPSTTIPEESKGKKRKRTTPKPTPQPQPGEEEEETPDQQEQDQTQLEARLQNLSAFQLRIISHAMSFPSATKITYSTCSVHAQENEHVVVRALRSDVARQRGWRILKREEQVEGMRRWGLRGSVEEVRKMVEEVGGEIGVVIGDVAEGCIRCEKGGEEGTMGFFVAGFVRDDLPDGTALNGHSREEETTNGPQDNDEENDDEEWNGFSEDEN